MVRRCAKCGDTKPLTEFYRCGKHGHRYWCKPCTLASNTVSRSKSGVQSSRNWKLRNLEANREQVRIDSKRRRAALTPDERRARRLKVDPIKRKAHAAVAQAVFYGRIVKPTNCQDCGKEFPKARIHGHHADYSKPLEVSWLCHTCHQKRHGRYIETKEGR
jgi:hypothetical protein